jgi:succinate dehydrogenase / fumarate reductase flavoprotein subunit/fumarate reductase (CoM/CoB) subunit A
MLTTAEAVVRSALARRESRGAHQREDFPAPDEAFVRNQVIEFKNDELTNRWISPIRLNSTESRNG